MAASIVVALLSGAVLNAVDVSLYVDVIVVSSVLELSDERSELQPDKINKEQAIIKEMTHLLRIFTFDQFWLLICFAVFLSFIFKTKSQIAQANMTIKPIRKINMQLRNHIFPRR